jgi:uncharacterized protein
MRITSLHAAGSGKRYVAISPEGDIYHCHQFVGIEELKIGHYIKVLILTE